MTTTTPITPASSAAGPDALAKPPVPRLPLTAGLLACATLALAIVLGPHASSTPIALLVAVSTTLLAAALVRRAAALSRSGAAAQIAVAVAAIGFAGMLWIATFTVVGAQLGLATWGTLLGIVLVSAGRRRMLGREGAGTPWQRLSGGLGQQREAQAVAVDALLLLGGGIVLVFGLLLGWGFVRDRLSIASVGGARELIYLALTGGTALIGLAIGVALMMWFWRMLGGGAHSAARAAAPTGQSGAPVASAASADPAMRPAAPTRDEPAVAAHLHDSVLQTLALIARAKDDPARVQQLARQQERSLRAWLAGRDEATASTLAGAIRVAAQEVEDEQPGARVEVVVVGDAALDRVSDAMVRAAREAMRNAARHAGSPVRVFVEVEGPRREVFVRDTGPGFDLVQVGEERRGVRDSIIGRMQHVGGTATIDSTPAGTEIALRCDAPIGDAGPAA